MQRGSDHLAAATAGVMPGGRLPAVGLASLAAVAAVAFGTLLPRAPGPTLAAVALIPLALAAPVASLAVLLFLTALVPFDVQNRLAVVGGEDVPGLLAVDILLVLGLCRVAVLVGVRRLRLAAPLVVAVALAVVVAVALVEGLARGADTSEAGTEARRLVFGIGAFILAWPILGDETQRRRLYPVLLALGVALGAWGLAQWLLQIEYTAAGDVGIRPGVANTSAGRGQLQGGLFAYPVAVVLACAALLMHRFRSRAELWLVGGILVLNAVCLLLTYERTVWAAAALGCVLVAVRGGPEARRRAVRFAPLAAVVTLAALVALGPGEVRTAAERLVSVGDYRTDPALEYREVESGAVADAIAARPVTGSGLGSTVTWGNRQFGTLTTPFAHNGYLWLAWKVGIPVAALIVLVLAAAAARRRGAPDDARLRILRVGSQASIWGLLLINITFPIFNTLGITAVLGLLVAVCVQPRAPA